MKKFKRNSIIRETLKNGEINELYPCGDIEEQNAIEASSQAIYYGDIKQFTFEYDELCDNAKSINHHIYTYTSYGDKPTHTIIKNERK